ncbi:MAG: hypothetical protein P1U46_01310 [Patescibacteria group bacterium]|nr:hypothetical protein [Patescibacteria group bacterium]
MFQFKYDIESNNHEPATIHKTQIIFNQYLNLSFILTNQEVTNENQIAINIVQISTLKFILNNHKFISFQAKYINIKISNIFKAHKLQAFKNFISFQKL